MLPSSASRDSITLLPGLEGPGGIPEVSSGIPSPPLAAYTVENERAVQTKTVRLALREGAAYNITEECERLFCATLEKVFPQKQLQMMSMHNTNHQSPMIRHDGISGFTLRDDPRINGISPAWSVDENAQQSPERCIDRFIEVYDYVGGARFRGFVAADGNRKAMFVFFDEEVLGCDLKAGLMALLELCDIPEFECSQLIVCLDRQLDAPESNTLSRDLGWVGFEPLTLDDWTEGHEIISDRWIFLGMET